VTHPRRIKEADLHKTIADLLDLMLLPPAFWTTFPAGWGKLTIATAGRLRGSGLKAGFPDILIIFNGRATGIELKAPGGALSKVQRHMILRLRGAGMMTYVCHSAEEVISALRAASLPVRNMEIAA
jgi:hypothetical protein